MASLFDETHPRLKGFNSFYEAEIRPLLSGLEDRRREALHKGLLILGPIALTGGATVLYGYNLPTYVEHREFTIIAGIILIIVGFVVGFKSVSKVKRAFDSQITGAICRFLGLTHSKTTNFNPVPYFRQLSLVPGYDRLSIEDDIRGTIGNAKLRLVEVKLEERRTRRDSKGRTKTYYVTVFKGLLIQVPFPKTFSSRTIIARDHGKIVNFFKSWGISGERVSLEDPDFERMFEVFSSDQVEARYLLTPRFMERIRELAGHFDKGIQLAFDNGHLLIAGPMRADMFESGSVFSDLTNPKHVQETLEELKIILDIVDVLNLEAKTKA